MRDGQEQNLDSIEEILKRMETVSSVAKTNTEKPQMQMING